MLVDRLDAELAKSSGEVCALVKHTGLGSPKGVLFEASDFFPPKGLGPLPAWGRRWVGWGSEIWVCQVRVFNTCEKTDSGKEWDSTLLGNLEHPPCKNQGAF